MGFAWGTSMNFKTITLLYITVYNMKTWIIYYNSQNFRETCVRQNNKIRHRIAIIYFDPGLKTWRIKLKILEAKLIYLQHLPSWSFYCLQTLIVWHSAKTFVCVITADCRNIRRGRSLNLSRCHHKLMNILFMKITENIHHFWEKNSRRHQSVEYDYLHVHRFSTNILQKPFRKLTRI